LVFYRIVGGEDVYDERSCCSPNPLKPRSWMRNPTNEIEWKQFTRDAFVRRFYHQCDECGQFAYPKSFPWNDCTGAHMFRAICPVSRVKRRYHCEWCFAYYYSRLIGKSIAQTGQWKHDSSTEWPEAYLKRDKSTTDLIQLSSASCMPDKSMYSNKPW
jgi:hypothetical protein